MTNPFLADEPTVTGKQKVIFCVPSRHKAHPAFFRSMEKSIPLIIEAGYDEGMTFETGNPYISGSRASMLKKALNANADIIVFIDDDVSWDDPATLLKLIQTPGEVVGGTYRCKEPDFSDNYMGRILQDERGFPISVRADGCIECACLPAGFLKVTKEAVIKFMRGYPELCYGPPYTYAVDLFNHGAWKGLWWGEDYAFCCRWRDIGGQVWMLADIDLDHNSWVDDQVWKGNFHQYLMRQPGGVNAPKPE